MSGAISLNKYVNITSGVGGAAAFPGRSFSGRIFTTNPLLPTGSFKDFSSAATVGAYFGTGSEEYARAAFYFPFRSKNITSPKLLSFGRWADVDTAPLIFGAKNAQVLANWTSISNGDFTLQMGSHTFHMTGLDFSAASSLSNVATIITSAIQAETGGGGLWTGTVVSWDSANSRFDLVGGATGNNTISVTAGVTHDIAGLLGWLTNAILSNGVIAETITTTLTNSASQSDNFGSYCFTYVADLDLAEVTESATWNINQDVKFQFYVAITAANATSWIAALAGYFGLGPTIMGVAGQYHEMQPMCIMAATVYSNPNSVQDYEFYQFPTLTPTVTDTATAEAYDALPINYLGQTQSAGVFRAFYQQGILLGDASAGAITDMGAYANEMWLKDAIADSLINLQLALPNLPADADGLGKIGISIQSNINKGLSNGTIVSGKPLSDTQIQFITDETDQANAWRQVQNIGYWYTVGLSTYQSGPNTLWKATYILIYADSEGIRLIDGTDILI